MLPKEHRLRLEKDFSQLFRKGRSVGNRFLVLKFRKVSNDEPLKVAFVISKKTEKTAVKRNRAKRQLREILRKQFSDLQQKGFHGSFIIKKPFLELSSNEQKEVVYRLLKKANWLV